MGPRWGSIAIAAAALLVAGCGSGSTEADFDPAVPEQFVLDRARADVRSDPALRLKEPETPQVDCREQSGERPASAEVEQAAFLCDVTVTGGDGSTIGSQTWRAQVEVDPTTGDTLVRSSRRLESTINVAE